jgi:hypothetical protein
MKDGKMTMEVQGDEMRKILGVNKDVKEVALESLTQSQAESLAEYQKRESEKTPEDIIRGQATNIELVTRDVNYILRLLTVESGKAGKSVMKSLDIDFDVISGKSKEMREKGGDYIKGASDEITSKLKNDKEVKKTAKVLAQMNSVESKTVDNSSSNANNQNSNASTGALASNTLMVNVTSAVTLDTLNKEIVRTPDFAHDIMSVLNTRGSYTQMG